MSGASAVLTATSFPEALGIWLGETLPIVAWLLVGLVMACVPIFITYGTMYALSKLAGRIRRNRFRR